MATITINNVPSEIVDEIGTNIKYTSDFKFPSRKRIINDKNLKVTYWDDDEISNLWKNSLITSNSF